MTTQKTSEKPTEIKNESTDVKNTEKIETPESKTSIETPESKTSIENKELIDIIDLLKRTQANFENYRKQTEKRISEIQQFAAQNIILQILPLYDNLELALKNIHPEEKSSHFVQGVQLIFTQLNQLLEQNGLLPIVTKAQLFDPYYHEALLKECSEFPENTIIEEFQKGFLLNGKVLRLAKVKISSGRQEKNKSQHKF